MSTQPTLHTPDLPPLPLTPWRRLKRFARAAIRFKLRALRRVFRITQTLALWGAFTGLLLGAILSIALRFFILPNLDQYRPQITAQLSTLIGQPVSLKYISGDWDGWAPHMMVQGLTVKNTQGQASFTLDRIDTTLSWWTLLSGELRFAEIKLYAPDLLIQRDAKGQLFMGGVPLTSGRSPSDTRFADWLLRQERLEITHASVRWEDALWSTPPVRIQPVNFVLTRHFSHHRFRLDLQPPADIASPLTLQGDLTGYSLSALSDWKGTIFTSMANVDIAKIGTWFPLLQQQTAQFKQLGFPQSGIGALRSWLSVRDGRVAGATLDVALANVSARLSAHTPPLDIKSLHGRLRWRLSASEVGIAAEKLNLTLQDGTALPKLTLSATLSRSGAKITGGQLSTTQLSLVPLNRLLSYLPLPANIQSTLRALSPQGIIQNGQLSWQGTTHWDHYQAALTFSQVRLQAHQGIPGFGPLSGQFQLTDQAGSATLTGTAFEINLPQLFTTPLGTQSLQAQLHWQKIQDDWRIALDKLSLNGPDAQGTFSGWYRTARQGAGSIDLTGNISRADARAVWKYLPITTTPPATREWLKSALVSGEGYGGTLRLYGNLDEYPFEKPSQGLFKITATARNVSLAYAPNWPALQHVSGKLLFLGQRMQIDADHADLFGVNIGKTTVGIANLGNAETLTVDGVASGPTAGFYQFVSHSPVRETVSGLVDNPTLSGNASLQLGLQVPLSDANNTAVKGALTFEKNRLQLNEEIPALDAASGTLEFTEKTLALKNSKATVLGLPARFAASTDAAGVVRVSGVGRINGKTAREAFALPLPSKTLQGETEWQLLLTLAQKRTDLQISSNLIGMAIDLPEPLQKTATESTPLLIERKGTDALPRWTVRLGGWLAAQVQFDPNSQPATLTRAAIQLDPTPGNNSSQSLPALPFNGIALSGGLKTLDADAWQRALANLPATNGVAGAVLGNIQIGSLKLAARTWHDLQLRAQRDNQNWMLSLNGKEIEGKVLWRPEGDGQLVARLSRLQLPDQNDVVIQAIAPATLKSSKPPALDIEADAFQMGDKKLGTLKILAKPEGADWRLQEVKLTQPEATWQLDGLWQDNAPNPVVKMNIKIEATDAGKLLDRLGYPGSLKRGSAKLDAQLAWAGSPFEPNWPTLAGKLNLSAKNGQFSKLEPGLGRLLGVLSLQSLPRRITLDFRDIFSEGLAFETLDGSAKIVQGVMSTDNLKIIAPSAAIAMKGSVDIVRETQQLHVRVVPVVGDSVAVGVAIANPIAGLITFLLQKVLRDPLGQLVAFEYDITGSWAQPNVLKTGDGRPPVSNKP